MELKERFHIIKKRLIIVIIITLATTLSGGILSYFLIKPQYKADISVIIGKTQTETTNSSSNYYDILLYQTMVQTYSKLTKSRIVIDNVIEELNLQQMRASDLLSMITVTPDTDTRFLTIAVTSKDQKQAVDIANQFAKSLKEISIKINKVDIVMLIDDARTPIINDTQKPIRNIAMAFFIGIIISIGLVFLLEYLDNTIKTKEDVETLLGLPVIGTISLVKIKDRAGVID
ncbi:MAG TPA: Wzz/FepE/Etk N-terminal domain-containing protein [Clostridium sp.]|uniref:YveK family protein n=1 Tax=Clostridium sp. TaxID=1506 RepID=UPI002F9338AC